ncbi:MAG: DMT family transporter [Kiritimatiellaeota bacterium]|nr:DMT family transporter [Kiritimatiellota bacterium]
MPMYPGETAALATAFLWMLSSLCWTAAGERVGSLAVNVIRLLIALPLLMLGLWLAQGAPVPLTAPPQIWLYLSLSGVFGFFVCDLFLFRSFLLIGPRLGMLILSLAPPLTALLGWLVLGEQLALLHWLGMGLTLAGVVGVILESPSAPANSGRRYVFTFRGGALAFLAAAGQAVAMVFAKMGLRTGISAMAATEIRLLAGLACFLVLLLVLRRYPLLFQAARDRRALGIITLGALAGPFLGVTLMMVAVRHIPTGLAQTFLALAPVMIIPFMRWLYKERVRWQAVAGAVLAFLGVALLFVK